MARDEYVFMCDGNAQQGLVRAIAGGNASVGGTRLREARLGVDVHKRVQVGSGGNARQIVLRQLDARDTLGVERGAQILQVNQILFHGGCCVALEGMRCAGGARRYVARAPAGPDAGQRAGLIR